MKFWKSREPGPQPDLGPAQEALADSFEPDDALPTERRPMPPDRSGPAARLLRVEYGLAHWTVDAWRAGADPELEVLGVEYQEAGPEPATGPEPELEAE